MPNKNFFATAFSFLSATRYHINGGLLLIITSLLALCVANSPLAEGYQALWQHTICLQIGDFNLFNHGGHPLTLLGFINDALMAIFFFSVGLEIKREILVGELSSLRQALLPIIAAAGGMVIPVSVYLLFTAGTPAASGFAIPMATDIAFSLGVLSLLGSRVPISLKVFLTAFAVVDDIGGILVIAFFYTDHLAPYYLLAAAVVVLLLVVGNVLQVRRRWFYLGLGLVLWYLFMQSGVHATLAGVIAAFTIPATPSCHIGKYVRRIKDNITAFPSYHNGDLLSKEQISRLKSIESASDRVISPLQSLEDSLHAPVNYIIMPLFAFANAGVTLIGNNGTLDVGPITLAIFMGLVVGKFLGIFFFSLLAVRLRLSALPEGMTYTNLAGVSLLGGIGFTVSLFIANLTFKPGSELLNQAKMGIVAGTFVAGILGILMLKASKSMHHTASN